MTKFDIRVRRRQFTQSRIEKHKNFQNLMGNYDRSSRIKTRGVMVIMILLILILAILVAFFGTIEDKKDTPPTDPVSYTVEKMQVEKINIEELKV